jgi:hypothetical protein
MCDPYNTEESLEKVLDNFTKSNFYLWLYPEKVMQKMKETIAKIGRSPPPKLIFMPTRELVRLMMRALLDFGPAYKESAFLLKFGLIEKEKSPSNESEDY